MTCNYHIRYSMTWGSHITCYVYFVNIFQEIFQLLFLYLIGRSTIIFCSCTMYLLPIRSVSSHKLIQQSMFHLQKRILVVKYHMRSKFFYLLMITSKICTVAQNSTLRINISTFSFLLAAMRGIQLFKCLWNWDVAPE